MVLVVFTLLKVTVDISRSLLMGAEVPLVPLELLLLVPLRKALNKVEVQLLGRDLGGGLGSSLSQVGGSGGFPLV